MQRPGTGAENYEDYQRDIERYQQRRRGEEPDTAARSSSLPPGLGIPKSLAVAKRLNIIEQKQIPCRAPKFLNTTHLIL
jgi:hypothetical protein